MAKMYSRFVIFSKSDRKGRAENDTERLIRYAGLLYDEKYDPTQLAKDVDFGEYWSRENYSIEPNTEYMAEITYYNNQKRIVGIMTKEAYLKMFQ